MALLLVLDVFRNIRWIGRGKQRLIFLVWHACILLHMGGKLLEPIHACMFKQVSFSDLSEPDDSDPVESESPSAPSTLWIHNFEGQKPMHVCMHA